MSWYKASLSVINEVVKQKGIEKVTIKDIDKAYPFSEKKRFPYKMWLKARKQKLISLGLVKIKTTQAEVSTGLFEFVDGKEQ